MVSNDKAGGIFMRVEKYYYSDANKSESDIQNTEKFQSFTQLSASSQSLAREIGANLFMDTDDHAGWITFICDVLSFKGAAKQAVQQLADVADEVTIRASVDTGANSPADVDNAVQLTFWFDFI